MKGFARLFIFLIASVIFSCAQENLSDTIKPWIDIDSLVQAQVSDARVEKSATLNGEGSTGSTSVAGKWREELEAFTRLGVMNKPVFKKNYIQTIGPDPTSNLLLKKIVATDSTAPVKELRMTVHPETWRIIRMEGILKESSLFYSKQEDLILEFDPHTGRLERYEVSGQQKLAWFGADQYEVRATVIYP